LGVIESWHQRFTVPHTFEYRGEQITWLRYESLIWTLGESFRRIMLRDRPLRKRERIFEAVRGVCVDRRFGKGRESFTMLLGHYGGPAQIPTLIGLLDDPQICGHAVYALRLLGASEAADRVRPFLDSTKTWVRQEARKYFRKIESVAQI
jgi:HEAT repeat protein